PVCGGRKIYKEKRRGEAGFYRCPASHPATTNRAQGPYVFSVRSGSLLEHSRVPLSKWVFLIERLPRGPAFEVLTLSVKLGVTRRTAARMRNLSYQLDRWGHQL